VLIKDNHIQAAGGIAQAVRQVRAHVPHTVKVELEVESLAEVQAALAENVEIIMLDNMTLAQMAEAVKVINGRALVEASGNVTLEGERGVRAVAETGVDIISVGALTHSAAHVDLSMKFV
jgi:nicotinate-nucleotide pyrophosphorylase (carboxylating)